MTSLGRRTDVSHGEAAAPVEVRRWRAFWLLAAAFLMTIIDLTIVNVALPTIGRKLHFPESDLQWVVTAYALTSGGVLLLGGRAADLLGRRRLFIVGLAIFTGASLACALAASDTFLIIMRGVQGLGTAAVLPAALSIVMNMFGEGAERNKALGIRGGVGAAAATVGVLAGGLLTPVRRLAVHLLPQRPHRRGHPAAGPPGGAGKQAGRRPPPLRPARRHHRDRRPGRPGLRDLAGPHRRLGIGPDPCAARGIQHHAGRLPGPGDQSRRAAAAAAPVPAEDPRRIQRGRVPARRQLLRVHLHRHPYMQQVLGYSALKTGLARLAASLTSVALAGVSQTLVTRASAKHQPRDQRVIRRNAY